MSKEKHHAKAHGHKESHHKSEHKAEHKSHSKKEKFEISQPNQEINPVVSDQPEKVLMRFHEDKFYNDQSVPLYEAGKIYEIEGKDFIQRWVRRGGEIVTKEQFESGELAPIANSDQAGDDAGKQAE